MEKIRNSIIAIGITGSVVGAIITIVLFAIGEWRVSYDAKVTLLSACNAMGPLTDPSKEPLLTLPVDTDQIYACGHLETSTPIRLAFLLFFEDQYLCTFVADQRFEQGYFLEPLCLPHDDKSKPGLYRIVIYHGRNRLGLAEFKLTAKEP